MTRLLIALIVLLLIVSVASCCHKSTSIVPANQTNASAGTVLPITA